MLIEEDFRNEASRVFNLTYFVTLVEKLDIIGLRYFERHCEQRWWVLAEQDAAIKAAGAEQNEWAPIFG